MPRPMSVATKPKNFGKTVRNLLTNLKPWRVLIIASMILTVASVILALFGPMILGQVTTEAVRSYTETGAIDWGVISSLMIQLILLYVGSSILNYLQGVALSVVTESYGKQLRDEIIKKIGLLPVSYFDKHQFGDTLSRMSNDVDAITQSMARILSEVISDIVKLIGIFVMMMVISVPLSLVALLILPLSFLSISQLAKKANA